MKKKLRYYCGLLALVLVAAIVCDLIHLNYSSSSDKEGEELYFGELPEDFQTTEEIEGGVRTRFKPVCSIDVNVYPRNYPKDYTLLSEVDGQVCRVDMKRVSLCIPADCVMQSKPFIITYAMLIPNLLLYGWLLFIVFQVLRSVSRKEVFVARIAKKLERAGFLLVAIWLWDYVRSFIATQILMQHVNMAYYDIKWFSANFTCLVIGLALMIVSQIILMGKELQEDQELTI
ncbi:MAG: DUF2975 domain-containing protein [Bacteroidaceae bacterium]|nr:DUF2975 domain-containing protein [Bacteroidaceae bacterium]